MANQEIVPASAFTKGTAERRKSATSFSLPGLASSGTYSANFDITVLPLLQVPSQSSDAICLLSAADFEEFPNLQLNLLTNDPHLSNSAPSDIIKLQSRIDACLVSV